MQTPNVKENVALKGVYRIRKAKLVTEEHFNLDREAAWLRSVGRIDEAKEVMEKLNAICEKAGLLETTIIDNIIPTVGRTMIANNLTSVSPTNVMLANYIALGSGTNTPANADTTLQTETYRNAVASRTNASNIAYVTGFFSATETSGTYREAAIFSNGTGSANSGVLVSRVAINVTKSTSETLTIDWTLTIS